MATATQDRDVQKPGRVQPTPKGRIGLIVAASLAIGLLAALALVAAPFVPAKENVLTGVALLGFAFGWALLAVLSARSSDQPQRWAVAPAVFMALAGLVSLIGSDAVRNVFGWVWPPVLLGLVVWMFIRARRQLRSRSGRWMLYPVLAVLMVASVGGGYQTVRQSIDTRAYPMPGQLVDVGGHRMHLHCTGSGSPTVVLEPGHGGASSDSRLGRARRGPGQHSVRLRPRRPRMERPCRRPAGRGADSRRPAHAARAGTGSRALRAGRSLLRRPVRPNLRRHLSRPGRRPGAPGLHRTQTGPGPAGQDRVVRASSVASPPCSPRWLTSEPDG